jgi:hypothetical protein
MFADAARFTDGMAPAPWPPEALPSYRDGTKCLGPRTTSKYHSQVHGKIRPAAGPLEALQDTALSVLGPGGGLLRGLSAGIHVRGDRCQCSKASAQSHPGPLEAPPPAGSGVLGPRIRLVTWTCFGPAGPCPVRRSPTRQAQRHAQDHWSTRIATDPVTRTAA